MKRITLVIVIIAVIGIAIYLILSHPKINLNNNVPTETKYSNSLLSYELTLKNPWRVAVNLSKYDAILKKTDALDTEADCAMVVDSSKPISASDLQNCLIKSPRFNELNKEFNDFQNNFTIENSEVVILTDLTEQEEANFIADIKSNKKTIMDFPSAHAIQIYPIDFDLCPQKIYPNTNSTLKISDISLNNGVKACQLDYRAMTVPKTGTILDSGLIIAVPRVFNFKIIGGDVAHGLVFKVITYLGSPLEKTFYDILNSFKFTQ
jgi:hypothetical protein